MNNAQAIKLHFEAIGTAWEIDIDSPPSFLTPHSMQQKIFVCIERFESLYSRFREDSLVKEMAVRKGEYPLANDGQKMFTLYKKLYDLSRGSFTPLIGDLLSRAGYDASYSFQTKRLKKPYTWDEAVDIEDEKITIRKPVLLDVGALGKGQLIDQLGNLLEEQGITAYCIDGSGDILYKNAFSKPLKIGLEHPEHTHQVIGVAEILNGSLCASSGNRRKWGRFHHIMNPQTLSSVNEVLATWVVADTAMEADALATCLFFVESKVLSQHFRFQYLLLKPDYTIQKSHDFPGELYYTT